MSIIELASAVAEITNKAIPSRREDAVTELQRLAEYHGKALAANEALLSAQIEKRMKQIREVFDDI